MDERWSSWHISLCSRSSSVSIAASVWFFMQFESTSSLLIEAGCPFLNQHFPPLDRHQILQTVLLSLLCYWIVCLFLIPISPGLHYIFLKVCILPCSSKVDTFIHKTADSLTPLPCDSIRGTFLTTAKLNLFLWLKVHIFSLLCIYWYTFIYNISWAGKGCYRCLNPNGRDGQFCCCPWNS